MKFLDQLTQHFSEKIVKAHPLFKKLHQAGWERFKTIGLPTKQVESYQYLPLSQFYIQSYEMAKLHKPTELKIPSEYKDSSLVFVDGIFMPQLSHFDGLGKEIVILPLEEAMKRFGHLIQTRLFENTKKENDPFVSLNLALMQSGIWIYIPPHVHIEKPIYMIHLSTQPSSAIFPRVQIVLGQNARLTWILSMNSDHEETYWSNFVSECYLEEQSELTLYLATDSHERAWHLDAFRGHLKTQSKFKALILNRGGACVRQDIQITLAGEKADAEIKGLWLLDEKRQAHTYVKMEHQAPSCRSMQHLKGVLADNSQSSFEGKIYIHQEAQHTEAYQLNHNLLLGAHAISNIKPNLEIFADDVKATHGATVSQVKKDQLLYLKTRGIPEPVARSLLVEGYCQEILDQAPHLWKQSWKQLIKKVLS